MKNETIILFAPNGAKIRLGQRQGLVSRLVLIALAWALIIGGFLAGWEARGRREPMIEWKSNSYEIGEPAAPPTYFPPGGHKNIS